MTVAHNPARRTAILLEVLAAVVFLASLWFVLVYHEDIDLGEKVVRELALTTWIIIAGAVLGAILVALLVLLFATQARGAAGEEPPYESSAVTPSEGVTVPEGMMLLRCGHCGMTFTAPEIAERPYYSNCPHCQARGVLNY